MRNSYYIAKVVYLESLKNFTLISMVIFGTVIFIASLFLNNVMLGEYNKLVVDIALSLPVLIGLIIIIFTGTRLVYDEIEKKTIYLYASKPIKRWEFMLGKYFGLSAVFIIITIILSIIAFIFMKFLHINYNIQYLLSLLFSIVELMIVLSVTMFFSSFSATPILTGVFSFGAYFAGHFAMDVYQYSVMTGNQLLKILSRIAYYLLPNLSFYNIQKEVTHGINISSNQIVYVLSYGILYMIIMLILSVIIFERKEF